MQCTTLFSIFMKSTPHPLTSVLLTLWWCDDNLSELPSRLPISVVAHGPQYLPKLYCYTMSHNEIISLLWILIKPMSRDNIFSTLGVYCECGEGEAVIGPRYNVKTNQIWFHSRPTNKINLQSSLAFPFVLFLTLCLPRLADWTFNQKSYYWQVQVSSP